MWLRRLTCIALDTAEHSFLEETSGVSCFFCFVVFICSCPIHRAGVNKIFDSQTLGLQFVVVVNLLRALP